MPKVCPVCAASYTDGNVFCPADGSTLRAAESEGDLIGNVVADRYLVTDLLGEGGMGKVYLARHVRLPQQAAIKVLRPAMLRDPAAVARFNREAANASRIEHEHIARVFDFGESSDGTVYLAMEYVPGRTLKAIITKEGALPPARTARLTRQIGEALDAAHRMNIVHRDLKPDNVMVIEDAEFGDRCKVVDFGIAKAMGGDASESGDAGLTKTGFIVGTPEYMSPEQLLGGVVDHRSDVYALALVSYHCLTGTSPFDTSTPERAMTARLVEVPRALATVRDDVAWPASVQVVFDRGLARSPDDRYDRAGTFARDLESAIQAWLGVSSESATVASEVTASSAPSAAATIAAAAPAGATPAINATSSQLHGATTVVTPRPSPAVPAPTKSRTPLVLGGLLGVVGVAAVAFVLLRPDGTDSAPAALPPATASAEQNVARAIPDSASLTVDEPSAAEATPAGVTPPPNRPTSAPVTQSSQQNATVAQVTPNTRTTPPVSEPVPVRGSATSMAAMITLDSIRRALDPLTATPADARRGVAALRQLMPRLGSAEDSAWAYLRQAEAHFIAEDERSACLALSQARPLVNTSGQRDILTLMTGALSVTC